MAIVQQDLDALEEAIVKGVKVVKYVDKEVTYRSLDEMLRVRDIIRKKLGLDTDDNTGGRGRRRLASYCKNI